MDSVILAYWSCSTSKVKDAETLSQLIGQQARHKAPPLRSTEPLDLEGDATKAALKRTLRGLDKGE